LSENAVVGPRASEFVAGANAEAGLSSGDKPIQADKAGRECSRSNPDPHFQTEPSLIKPFSQHRLRLNLDVPPGEL
ncbi:MAG: hypothetical protein ACLFWL_06210, partial [Candidatus Brocadiia bacterium]